MATSGKFFLTGQLLGGMPDTGTPFAWRRPDGTQMELAPAGGLEGLSDSIDMMEKRAQTDPEAKASLDYHKRGGDFLQHSLHEANGIVERDQFAEHTKRFINTTQALLGTISQDPEKAHQLFRKALSGEVSQLLEDMKPYKVIRNEVALNFTDALERQRGLSLDILRSHLCSTGAILASFDSAYFRDWGRDAGIVFRAALSETPLDQNTEKWFDQHIGYDEVFREHARNLNFPGGLAEARANIYGYPPYGPWGTPQFDAAALKAIAFSDYGAALTQKGDSAKAGSQVYPAVREYLEDLINNNGKPCFDPWEEIEAEHHFWTEMAKATAFSKGGDLAESLGNAQDAARYRTWRDNILNNSLQLFLQDSGDRIIFPHYHVLNFDWSKKRSILDSQVLGALLLGKEIGYPVSLDHPYALHTLASILDVFKTIYLINQENPNDAIAVGRYPDDLYGGPDISVRRGNPWIIATLWSGRYFFELALKYLREGKVGMEDGRKEDLEKLVGFSLPSGSSLSSSDPLFQPVVNRLVERGDEVLRWVLKHARDGWMSEQINRVSGLPCSVLDLTWSHAEFLQTLRAKKEADEAIADHIHVASKGT